MWSQAGALCYKPSGDHVFAGKFPGGNAQRPWTNLPLLLWCLEALVRFSKRVGGLDDFSCFVAVTPQLSFCMIIQILFDVQNPRVTWNDHLVYLIWLSRADDLRRCWLGFQKKSCRPGSWLENIFCWQTLRTLNKHKWKNESKLHLYDLWRVKISRSFSELWSVDVFVHVCLRRKFGCFCHPFIQYVFYIAMLATGNWFSCCSGFSMIVLFILLPGHRQADLAFSVSGSECGSGWLFARFSIPHQLSMTLFASAKNQSGRLCN